MTDIQLYKFINENSLEYHNINESDIILFVDIVHIKEWDELLGYSIKDDYGIKCFMKDGYFVFYMDDICQYFGIELKDVFK